MNQEERTRRSRDRILEAALELFSHQGFRATTVREIAERAGRSTGTVYHLFSDKEEIFRVLLDQYWAAISRDDYPVTREIAAGEFPDNLEAIGFAARESVETHRRHIALIYVDVVEFEGEHIRQFYAGMAERFRDFIDEHPQTGDPSGKLRPGITPDFAVMLASRIFLQYFAVEILFGVPNHFGQDSARVVHEIAEVLRRGMLRRADDAHGDGSRADGG
ncbi:MAG: TetR/AcrR family transcriptional regulator [Acidobacteriota bacterium]